MGSEFMTVRSKAYVQPAPKKRILVRIVNFLVIVTVILAIANILVSGFQIQILLTYSFLALILSGYSRMEGNRPHYEFYLADLLFEEKTLSIDYRPQGKNQQPPSLVIPYQILLSAEYSTQLSCVRISFGTQVEGASNKTYHLLYMEQLSVSEFSSRMERIAGVKVVWID